MLKRCAIVMCMLVALFFAAGIVMAAENETVAAEGEATTTAIAEPEVTPAPMDVVEVGNKICPVSGMLIIEPGKYIVEYEGKVYNLCSETCKDTFLGNPTAYVAKVETELEQGKDAPAVDATEYSGEKMEVGEEALVSAGEEK